MADSSAKAAAGAPSPASNQPPARSSASPSRAPGRRRGVTLNLKLAALVTLLLVLTVGAVYSFVERTMRETLTEEILGKGRALVQNLRANASEARASGDDLLVGTYVDKLTEEKGVLYAAVYDEEGLVIAHSDHTKAKGTKLYGAPPAEETAPRQLQFGRDTVYEFVLPLEWQGKKLGTAQLGLSASLIRENVQKVRETVLAVTAGLLGVGLLLSWLFVTLMTRPLKELARAAHALGTGNFEYRVPVKRRDELGALAEIFNQMAERLKGVQEQVVQREKAAQQVEIAREISESLLPSAVPKLPGLDIEVRTRVGKSAETEYYDFIDVSQTQIGIVLADVYDSGIHRAVSLAKVRSLMRYQAMGNNVASSVLSGVNFLLYREKMSVRMSYAVLDTAARTLSIASAGYLPLFHYDAASGELQEVNPGGMAMGLDMGSNFNYFLKNKVFPVAAGDWLVWISAGAGAALERRKREANDPTLTSVVSEHVSGSARELAASLDKALVNLIGEIHPSDAYLVMVVKVLEPVLATATPAPVLRPGTLTAVPAAPPPRTPAGGRKA